MAPKTQKKGSHQKIADTFILVRTTLLLIEGTIVEGVDIIAICFCFFFSYAMLSLWMSAVA